MHWRFPCWTRRPDTWLFFVSQALHLSLASKRVQEIKGINFEAPPKQKNATHHLLAPYRKLGIRGDGWPQPLLSISFSSVCLCLKWKHLIRMALNIFGPINALALPLISLSLPVCIIFLFLFFCPTVTSVSFFKFFFLWLEECCLLICNNWILSKGVRSTKQIAIMLETHKRN